MERAPDAPSPAGVAQALRGAADPDGFVPFDRFMDVALYGAEVGYYARARTAPGPGGDFYTAVHASPLFASAFAAHVGEMFDAHPAGRPFDLVEIGPGDGRLSEGILRGLAGRRAPVHPDRVILVERASPLRAAAFARVHEATAGSARVLSADSVAAIGPFEGVVVANELLDAQPVRRLLRVEGGWHELGIRLDGDRPVPAQSRAVRPVPGLSLPLEAPAGTVIEISPMAEGLVREVADHLVAGRLLLADFGLDEPELLAGHPTGTLDALKAHRSGFDALESPGATDLSAFVNWTRVRQAAAAAGLRPVADRSQAETLGAWGFERLLNDAVGAAGSAEAEVRVRLSAKNLLFGFERFRVLEYDAGSPGSAA
jgi:SAM-dependent MidA family methyltransferase